MEIVLSVEFMGEEILQGIKSLEKLIKARIVAYL